jgi:hypothetical protein
VIRLLVTLAIVLTLAFCGATVKLGNRTFFGHVRAIWATDEAKDLKNGVKKTAGPAVGRLKRGVEAGYNAMKDGSGSGSGSAAQPQPQPTRHK